ncbi:hypothetical protein E4T56_gene8947 [Termitomyces sp. T112]|nr:hypothetical protein E4T56_gene8947 [Termitomyces sp. T112]KAH0583684.1 hypothetical protein H2248_009297 [Termitomyces sp. 'cryptogamus']
MPVAHHWEWTRKELQLLSLRNYVAKETPDGEFEPGDFAYYEGSLHEAFTEFLKRKGYRLTPTEDTTMPKKGRYCLVLQRLSQDEYIVCYCASYGGAKSFHDIKDPVARHFGIPLNENATWPGVSPLKTLPPWKSTYGAYLLAIPMVCEGLLPSNIQMRIRLLFRDVQRLRRLIVDRSQSFDRYADELRAGHSKFILMGSSKMPHIHQEIPTKVITHRKFLKRQPFQHPNRFNLSNDQQNLFWLLRDIQSGVLAQSLYLNSLQPRERPLPAKLPIPFFAPTLRVSPITITRLLSRSRQFV